MVMLSAGGVFFNTNIQDNINCTCLKKGKQIFSNIFTRNHIIYNIRDKKNVSL